MSVNKQIVLYIDYKTIVLMKFERYIAMCYIRKVYLHVHATRNFCAGMRSKFVTSSGRERSADRSADRQ